MKGMTHKVYVPIDDSDKITDMINWCYKTIDKHNLNWEWSYVDDSDLNSDVHFYFRKEQDAIIFALRWL